MSGGRGKIVWLPTFDSDKHIKTLVDKNKPASWWRRAAWSRRRWKRS